LNLILNYNSKTKLHLNGTKSECDIHLKNEFNYWFNEKSHVTYEQMFDDCCKPKLNRENSRFKKGSSQVLSGFWLDTKRYFNLYLLLVRIFILVSINRVVEIYLTKT